MASTSLTFQSEVLPLRRVLLKHARDAFVSPERIAEQWASLGYLEMPSYDLACAEYDAFAALLERLGVGVDWMPAGDLGLDSIYVRDAALVSDAGWLPCSMGKPARAREPEAQRQAFGEALGLVGEIGGAGTIEGGDVAWLDPATLAVGRGYRTSAGAIERLRTLLPDVEIVEVPLPHWKGPSDVFHLMSMLSPLAEDLLLVYSPLLPVPFREELLARGFQLVEVPDEEFESQGCNVLTVAPRVAVALEGNPETRRRMEAAGVEVHGYTGRAISLPGCGGPTCLTRPLERSRAG